MEENKEFVPLPLGTISSISTSVKDKTGLGEHFIVVMSIMRLGSCQGMEYRTRYRPGYELSLRMTASINTRFMEIVFNGIYSRTI